MQSTIQTISYDHPEDRRILKSCLSQWFQNPKDLNLTDPKMKFPFHFDMWVKRSYSMTDNMTFIAKNMEWIIGYISLRMMRTKQAGHLFHLIVDRNYRKQGVGTNLVKHIELFAKNEKLVSLTLNVAKKNNDAIRLYTTLGYEPAGETASGSFIYRKKL
ncbi:MAG: GNAT family N-acetyltransferase [Candidatus Marinimicrobia bacterium]|jgi:ribosomal protein S18 acetylase RimI-like enzyme|nr:GNAT family N-acetyltransferase [Candidatus Neomarinimicrobiota bacterium]MBT3618545.1 GNAT family N-acetyltransferase [Candidatus Neomarinimicrobiota bacterium]MBT3828951.1 GNAT family N-acetyltransferase [Candidatus Neomarinimicrobiota bacterium]MBT3997335.1 GNAT family N-acetyltransferase [Candidatus Neomarinimicrobiota bacterium]MBT4281143.1 GNAT family N-acetyltransferase [Candidatus Neomarinimicrobiota bacterium]